ncbi:hypothetical protein LP419_16955 [Massilia sp. H-1]|nr:hypothetical protein LP419_16955 [Massilia sp. H-1]
MSRHLPRRFPPTSKIRSSRCSPRCSHPDPFKPWSKAAPSDITGSGVVIEGKRILTNAHVVGYASQVQVQANQAERQGLGHRRRRFARHGSGHPQA